MKRLCIATLAFFFFSITSTVQAQCFPAVPSHAQVIPFGSIDSSYNHPGSVHHLCFNSFYYYFNNTPDTIYMDGSSILTIGFCQNLTIYMRNNCQLHIDTASGGLYQIKKIVYDTAYTWMVDTGYATIDSLVECPGMLYNYANFPGGGSPCLMAIENEMETPDFHIYPTVGSGDINIQTSMLDYTVEIYDVVGRKVNSSLNKTLISISGQSQGMYLVVVLKDNRPFYTQKIFLSK